MVVDEDEAEDEEMSSEEKEDLLDYDGTLVYSFKDEARKKLGIDQLPKAEKEYVLAQTDNLAYLDGLVCNKRWSEADSVYVQNGKHYSKAAGGGVNKGHAIEDIQEKFMNTNPDSYAPMSNPFVSPRFDSHLDLVFTP